MGAVARPFDLHHVGLTGNCASHTNGPERGLRTRVGKSHTLQGVACAKQFRQLSLIFVEVSPGRDARRPSGLANCYGGIHMTVN